MSAHKSMPMTKEEVMQLVKLVEANPVVYSKATNASNNQLKEATWATITDSFNSVVASSPRRPEQLRLKWENLKKAARKRNTRIRMNNLKTGSGKPDYIPPNDTLEKVASILGPTCKGYSVQFGGDAEVMGIEMESVEEVVVDLPSEMQKDILSPALSPRTPKCKLKQQTLTDEVKMSIIDRNKAIAEYYTSKKKQEEELHKLKKRKLEIMMQKLENHSPYSPGPTK